MTTTTEQPQRTVNEWCLNILADIAYETSSHLNAVDHVWNKVPRGRLKDFLHTYRSNQTVWKLKILRVMDDMGKAYGLPIGQDMRRDLEGTDFMAYADAIIDLKKAKDMEGCAWAIKILSQVEDINAISTSLKLIIQNQINKENLCK